jgi:RNA polymerase sigma factor (sigma-70 family)
VAIRPNRAVRRGLETLFHLGTIGDLSDGQLLERFTTCGGDAAELAFTALVERHGPMVLRVCRGSLKDPNDAQDAFQATFLVLVQKARSLWVQDSLGPWLHRVAHRIAYRARRSAARRREHERRAAESRPAWISGREDGMDDSAVLHEEIDRLPDHCRLPVVLCDLEGLTHEQVARHLGWPIGTVKSRLTRGREWLRARLVRRGLAPAAGLAGGASIVRSASAAVPAELVEATARAARALAAGAATAGVVPATVALLVEGALNAMLMSKLKYAVLACSLLATGAFVVAQPAGRAPQPRAQPVKARAARIPEAASKATDDATRGEAAVAREVKRLELDLIAAEVEMLRVEVTNALEERERRGEIARQVVPSDENEESVRRRWAEQAEKAAEHYQQLRAQYLTEARKLMTARQRLGLDPNWEQDRREESPSEAPSREQPGEPPAGKSGPHRSGAAIGSVDMDAVGKRYENLQRLEEQLKRDRMAAEQSLAKSQAQIKKLTEQMKRLPPASSDYIALENQIAELKGRLGTEEEREQRESVRRETRMMSTLYQEIHEVIAKVAKAKGLDYVVRVSSGPGSNSDFNEVNDALGRSVIFYANPRNDITEEVIRELNRKFKAAEAKPAQ